MPEKLVAASEFLKRYPSFFAALFVAAVALNWPWEMLQMHAYAEMAGRTWRETALPCLRASLGDAALTVIVYGVVALAAGRVGWAVGGKWNTFAAAALLGAACAVAFERKALVQGWWSYTDRMPTVPVLGVGLWPLLQLTLLVPAAAWIAGMWNSRTQSARKP